MKVNDVSFPLYLDRQNIIHQIETIGLAFNRYNDFSIKSKGFRCCSIALNKTKIVSIGINQAKTTPHYKDYADVQKMTIHAEIDMIMNIERDQDFKKVTDVYVVRGYSQLLPSIPCFLCVRYLAKKFKKTCNLHYFDDDTWHTLKVKDLERLTRQ